VPRLFAHTELILDVTEPAAGGLLVRTERVLVVARESEFLSRDLFARARGCVRVVAQEQVLVTRSLFLCIREAVDARRESSYCARCIGAHAERVIERVIIARSGPIRPNTHQGQIGAHLCASGRSNTRSRECVCIFMVSRRR
jgi:hypothetical protein